KVFLILLGALFIISTLTNWLLPARTSEPERLQPLDKARAEEVLQLRRTFGDTLWPGFGTANIPLLLYNESYVFLIGYDGLPPTGWRKVPQEIQFGGSWEQIGGATIDGRAVFRQPLPPNRTPEAFTVRVGDRWAASMTLREWTVIRMGNELRDALPGLLRLFVPYRLISLGMGTLFGTEWFISAVEHESFHAFQGLTTPGRLARAERLFAEAGGRYPWEDPGMTSLWKAEMKLLTDALTAEDQRETVTLVRRSLEQRDERRRTIGLDSMIVQLEQEREWEEGLAKYVELALWKVAANAADYQPVLALKDDAAFDQYKDFEGQWKRELSTMKFQGGSGESRFYYSGMAQAFLLDRLWPEWSRQSDWEEARLEEILRKAVTDSSTGK
ncbi:MAG: hypothetical protein R3350_07120, partial [Saprospiraceae bacterium]|nr:hypothetical protein [Saprospiraceae bacterium]